MSGHFSAAFVGRTDGGRKLRGRDEHIRFEIVDALIQPEIHRVGGVVGAVS